MNRFDINVTAWQKQSDVDLLPTCLDILLQSNRRLATQSSSLQTYNLNCIPIERSPDHGCQEFDSYDIKRSSSEPPLSLPHILVTSVNDSCCVQRPAMCSISSSPAITCSQQDLEREYDRHTWRMYNRILEARRNILLEQAAATSAAEHDDPGHQPRCDGNSCSLLDENPQDDTANAFHLYDENDDFIFDLEMNTK